MINHYFTMNNQCFFLITHKPKLIKFHSRPFHGFPLMISRVKAAKMLQRRVVINKIK